MKKDDIVKHIRALKPNQALQTKGKSLNKQGSTFDEDVIRVTGTREFIDSVLSHLKEPILSLENEVTALKLIYAKNTKNPDKFNFYAIPEARAINYDYELVQLMRRQQEIVAKVSPRAAREMEQTIQAFQNRN
jgi:hypothetical protein